MKAAFVAGKNRVQLREVNTPEVKDGEILVKMRASGICGTDIEKMKGESVTGVVLGHEVAGDIAKLGKGVKDFDIGQRVAVHHHVPCHRCHYCRHGDFTMCNDFSKVNIDPCGFAEYFRVPEAIVSGGGVILIPRNLSYEEGALLEPTGCCLKAITKSELVPGDTAMVIGCGPTGVTQIQLLKEMGCGRILAADIIPERLDWARRFGADQILNASGSDFVERVQEETEGRGTDVTIVSTSSVTALRQALYTVRKGGRVVIFGAPPKGSSLTLDASIVFIREIKVIPSYSTSELEMNAAVELVSGRRIDLASLVTHRFELGRFAEAMRLAARSAEALKVVVTNK